MGHIIPLSDEISVELGQESISIGSSNKNDHYIGPQSATEIGYKTMQLLTDFWLSEEGVKHGGHSRNPHGYAIYNPAINQITGWLQDPTKTQDRYCTYEFIPLRSDECDKPDSPKLEGWWTDPTSPELFEILARPRLKLQHSWVMVPATPWGWDGPEFNAMTLTPDYLTKRIASIVRAVCLGYYDLMRRSPPVTAAMMSVEEGAETTARLVVEDKTMLRFFRMCLNGTRPIYQSDLDDVVRPSLYPGVLEGVTQFIEINELPGLNPHGGAKRIIDTIMAAPDYAEYCSIILCSRLEDKEKSE